MRRLTTYGFLLFFCVQFISLVGCTEKRPSGVFSRGQMEDILYDYHLARAMADNNEYPDFNKEQMYVRTVFKKYNITEAQFDSSLSWYSRHSNELADIYKDVQKRLKSDLDDTNKLLSSTQNTQGGTTAGDSVDIWTFARTSRLTSDDLHNKLLFSITSDSTFHERDIFEWSVKVIEQGMSDPTHGIVMSITIHYMNDSTCSRTIPINNSGFYLARIQNDTLGAIRNVKGFIYVPKGSRNILIVNVKSLMRYHAHGPIIHSSNSNSAPQPLPNGQPMPPTTATQPSVSGIHPTTVISTKPNGAPVKADTAKPVVIPITGNRRMTPEELNKKRTDTSTPRGYQIRQQELEKQLQKQSKSQVKKK
jgi:hypothetical protein